MFCCLLLLSGCKKFLDEKSNKSFIVPSSVSDLQALLDENQRMNTRASSLGEVSADNYFTKQSYLDILPPQNTAAYKWDSAIFISGAPSNDWSETYDPVYYANIALEYINKFDRTPANAAGWDNVKGSALFYRAKSFLEAVWTWAAVYEENSNSLGIPLRLGSDFNVPSTRATLQQSYDQIIEDLSTAVQLLPIQPLFKTRPSKPAAYAMLARTYLSMQRYKEAGSYADSCLQLYYSLINYNKVDSNAVYPFERFNDETIFYSKMSLNYAVIGNDYANVNTALINDYKTNDLRKSLFFYLKDDSTWGFRGSYDGTSYFFNGIATDELYLILAECEARAGQVTSSLKYLNTLMTTRVKTGSFVPYTAANAQQALKTVLDERRKELVFRGLRWIDIKRLNKEGAGIIPVHSLGIQQFSLTPNDNKYALPIPSDIIKMTGMQQNPR